MPTIPKRRSMTWEVYPISMVNISLPNIANPSPNERICIVVYGNIASGKTTFSKALNELIPDYKLVNLDDYRLELNHPGQSFAWTDHMSKERLTNELKETNLTIYESTGVTEFFYNAVQSIIPNTKMVYIHIQCPPDVCINRYNQREQSGYKAIIPPNDLSTKEVINLLDTKYKAIKNDMTIVSGELNNMINILCNRLNIKRVGGKNP